MADELTADQHCALAMDFREGSRTEPTFDTGDRLMVLAQFHATMAVAARLAEVLAALRGTGSASVLPQSSVQPMSLEDFRAACEQAADRLRGPLPKDDPNGVITRVKELAKVVTEGIVDGQVTDAQAGYIAVALYNNGLLRKNDD